MGRNESATYEELQKRTGVNITPIMTCFRCMCDLSPPSLSAKLYVKLALPVMLTFASFVVMAPAVRRIKNSYLCREFVLCEKKRCEVEAKVFCEDHV